MSRKFACLFLAVSTLFSSLAIVYANEKQARIEAYTEAAAVLSDAGVASHTETALTVPVWPWLWSWACWTGAAP